MRATIYRLFSGEVMSLMTKFAVGLLSFAALMTGALPAIARPATLINDSNLRTGPSLTDSIQRLAAA